MISESEIALKQTEFFINELPTDLVLHRDVKIADGAGGFKDAGDTNLPPQKVRIVGSQNANAVVTDNGIQITIEKFLVGMPDFDVEVGDRCEIDGHSFEVVQLQPDVYWRRVAGVIRRGE